MIVPATPNLLDFLWLEITPSCNESCFHCYNDSGPHRAKDGSMDPELAVRVMSEAVDLGCRTVQFIGGEPTMHSDLCKLIDHAGTLGLSVEVFTNATRVDERLIRCCARNNVLVAVSIHSDCAKGHDSITQLPGSHARTVSGISRLTQAGVRVRAGVVDFGDGNLQKAVAFAESLGVEYVKTDKVRGFGRGEDLVVHQIGSDISELCGNCADGRACVLPNGDLVPCIMSRQFVMGTLLTSSLEELFELPKFDRFRERIQEELPQGELQTSCGPQTNVCCSPCNPMS